MLASGRDEAAEAWYRRYHRRLQQYCPTESITEVWRADRPPAWLQRGSSLVALQVQGRTMTSEQLAQWLQQRLNAGKNLTFLIGGPDGLPADLLKKAEWTLSLSPLTLPHHLARIVLAEQLYRAFTILNGHPYHLGH